MALVRQRLYRVKFARTNLHPLTYDIVADSFGEAQRLADELLEDTGHSRVLQIEERWQVRVEA